MMQPVKYVVGLVRDDNRNWGLEAIVFAKTMTHKNAAQLFHFGNSVVGAGFVTIEKNNDGETIVSIHGRSESLGIDPSFLDQKYLERALGVVSSDPFLSPMSDSERTKDYTDAREIIGMRQQQRRVKMDYKR